MTERLVFLGQKAELTLLRLPHAALTVRLSGEWKLGRQLPQGEEFRRRIESAETVSRITFDTQAMTGWDSGLITFLLDIIEVGSEMHIPVAKDGLPAGVQRILALAAAVPERKESAGKQQEALLSEGSAARRSPSGVLNNSVFLDADTKTMIAAGEPRKLLTESRDPKVINFLTRGEGREKEVTK